MLKNAAEDSGSFRPKHQACPLWVAEVEVALGSLGNLDSNEGPTVSQSCLGGIFVYPVPLHFHPSMRAHGGHRNHGVWQLRSLARGINLRRPKRVSDPEKSSHIVGIRPILKQKGDLVRCAMFRRESPHQFPDFLLLPKRPAFCHVSSILPGEEAAFKGRGFGLGLKIRSRKWAGREFDQLRI